MKIVFEAGSPAMLAIERHAATLSSRRKASPTQRKWIQEQDLVGVYGEAAFCQLVGAQLGSAYAAHGNRGVNVTTGGRSYDVKATMITNGRLMMPEADSARSGADRLVLAIVSQPRPGFDVTVRLVGWIEREFFLRLATRQEFRVVTLVLDSAYLKDVEDLESTRPKPAKVERVARPAFQSFDDLVESLAKGKE